VKLLQAYDATNVVVSRKPRSLRLRLLSDVQSARGVVVRTMGVSLVTLPVQAIAGGLTTYLCVRAVGVEAYATVGLLLGLQGFSGFLNLGTPAALSTAAGEASVRGDDRLARTFVTALRSVIPVSAIAVLVAIALAVTGAWPGILGSGRPDLLTAGAIVVVVGVALLQPMGLQQAVLMSCGRAGLAIVGSTTGSVAALAGVAVAAGTGAPVLWFVVLPMLGQLAAMAVWSPAFSRIVGTSTMGLIRAAIDRRYRGVRIRLQSTPALVIWIFLPLAYQTDRIVLGHLSTSAQLASYNVACQVFTPVLGIVTVGSASLWGHYAMRRIEGSLPSQRAFAQASFALGAAGMLLGIGYLVCMPYLSDIVTGNRVSVSSGLALAFALFMIAQSFHQPSAMLQTDVAGLRFNAVAVVVMTVLNIVMSVALARPLGASGPVLASTLSLTIALAIPSFVRGWRILGVQASNVPVR
jgi:O-antigen/teichoic acid export membrane protein